MTNSLIFFDFASDDPDKAGKFYAEVFGWEDDPRMGGLFHRMVPGGFFKNKDGSDSEIGTLATEGRKARVWILVSEDDTPERILETAEKLGATVLWRNHYWKEFNGFNWAFRDPWGNEIILWIKGGDNPQIPDNFTRE